MAFGWFKNKKKITNNLNFKDSNKVNNILKKLNIIEKGLNGLIKTLNQNKLYENYVGEDRTEIFVENNEIILEIISNINKIRVNIISEIILEQNKIEKNSQLYKILSKLLNICNEVELLSLITKDTSNYDKALEYYTKKYKFFKDSLKNI